MLVHLLFYFIFHKIRNTTLTWQIYYFEKTHFVTIIEALLDNVGKFTRFLEYFVALRHTPD